MEKLKRFVFRFTKGVYDILATYLLLWVGYITLVSLGLHAGFSLLAGVLDFESVELMWIVLARRVGIDTLWLRLVIFGGLQLWIFWLLKGPLGIVMRGIERGIDAVQRGYTAFGAKLPRVRAATGVLFSVAVTALLIPAVIQPTLVPMKFGERAMTERAANLLDGEAVLGFRDSVVGFYRKLYAKPPQPVGLPKEELDKVFGPDAPTGEPFTPPVGVGSYPMMDRWDPYIWTAASNEPEQFAYIKAFMWVESAGRQFAVSRTGCMGLMQFCSRTAKSQPYRDVFGVGQIYRCNCGDQCKVSKQTRRDMESGDSALVDKYKDTFPCELTDARFNGPKAIMAGNLYIKKLRESYGGNIYLMYIGYNSGPSIASKVYEKLGRRPDAGLDEIEQHLADTLRPRYGASAPGRARGLVRTHLPKIKKAYDGYLRDATATEAVALN